MQSGLFDQIPEIQYLLDYILLMLVITLQLHLIV